MDKNNVIGKRLSDLPTPAFCVDLDRVENNCQKMLDTAKRFGIQLRAQMKTHKTMYVLRELLEGRKFSYF